MDIIAHVDYGFLERFGKQPGTMHLVDHQEVAALRSELPSSLRLPGGSAANTARGIAWLASQSGRALCESALGVSAWPAAAFLPPVFSGAIGRDATGDEFAALMETAGVCASLVRKASPTGTSVILVTPDGERTMNTFLGACRDFAPEDLDFKRLAASRILYLTGYLWDTENQREAAEEAASSARAHGIPVAFDLADPWVVERYLDRFRDWVPRSVDLLFANGKELALLTGAACDEDCMAAAKAIAPVVVMKVGARGCWVGGRDAPRAELVPTEAVKPLDTTGAGDSFAGGWLYGVLRGREPAACARLANAVARGIVGVYGCDYEAVGAPPA
jgi:sugar/nucleoside kinase (ribokinase family)